MTEHRWRRMARLSVAAGALVLAVAGSGCGTLGRAELTRGVESMQAVAAEAQLVARDVARDRTKATFVRVHAGALSDDAGHEAQKLHDATPQNGLAGERDAAEKLASELADTIGQLVTAPGDERAAQETERHLALLERRAEAQGRRLR